MTWYQWNEIVINPFNVKNQKSEEKECVCVYIISLFLSAAMAMAMACREVQYVLSSVGWWNGYEYEKQTKNDRRKRNKRGPQEKRKRVSNERMGKLV